MPKTSEYDETIKLANKILDRPNADPDDDLAMLSRQLLRQVETVQRLKKDLEASHDPTGDLIQANRDAILRKHEEAVSRVRRCLEGAGDANERITKAEKVLHALGLFHPMHCESWCGWPDK